MEKLSRRCKQSSSKPEERGEVREKTPTWKKKRNVAGSYCRRTGPSARWVQEEKGAEGGRKNPRGKRKEGLI